MLHRPRLKTGVTIERLREPSLLFVFRPLPPVPFVRLVGSCLTPPVALPVGLDAAPLDAPFAGAALVFLALPRLADMVQIDNISHIRGFRLAKLSPATGEVVLAGYFVPQR